MRFEAALAEHFGVAADRIVAVANATAGLTLSLLATTTAVTADDGGPTGPGGLCVMPAWTHEATAVAALRAGLTPWFHDVDDSSWEMDPRQVAASIAQDRRVSHVLVTAPFGAAVDQTPWAALAQDANVTVVIDAAAGFDALQHSRLDAVVSLHATKVFGVGEGGVAIAADAARAARIRHLSQLGLSPDRIIGQAGMNAKLSEYGAAIGLAGLDDWPARRRRLADLRRDYLAALDDVPGVRPWAPAGISSTLMVRLPPGAADRTAAKLREAGIETRRWWGRGCHRQPALAGCPRTALPVTEALADSALGLPFHTDVTPADIDRIVANLRGCLP